MNKDSTFHGSSLSGVHSHACAKKETIQPDIRFQYCLWRTMTVNNTSYYIIIVHRLKYSYQTNSKTQIAIILLRLQSLHSPNLLQIAKQESHIKLLCFIHKPHKRSSNLMKTATLYLLRLKYNIVCIPFFTVSKLSHQWPNPLKKPNKITPFIYLVIPKPLAINTLQRLTFHWEAITFLLQP